MSNNTDNNPPDFIFNLDDVVRDKVSGYIGLVLNRTQYLYKNNIYGVKAKVLKDGNPLDLIYFEELQLEITENKNWIGFTEGEHTSNRNKNNY